MFNFVNGINIQFCVDFHSKTNNYFVLIFTGKKNGLSYLSAIVRKYHCSSFLRKACVLSFEGLSITSAGLPCSTITPPSMNTTWSEMLLAKAISWVTITIVIFSSASSFRTFSISAVSSGSSASDETGEKCYLEVFYVHNKDCEYQNFSNR